MKKFILLTAMVAFCSAISYAQPGSLDPSFGNKGIVRTDFGVSKAYPSSGSQVLVASDGSMFVIVETGALSFIIKLFPDGSRDFGYGLNGYSDAVKISRAHAVMQPDGKIVVAGYTEISRSSDYSSFIDGFGVARYNTDGSLDNTFDDDGKLTTSFGRNFFASLVMIQNDGRIVVFGPNGWPDINNNMAIARYNPDGSPDNTFNGNGQKVVFTNFENFVVAAVQNDGKILVEALDGNYETILLRLNSDGTTDSSFGNDGILNLDFYLGAIAIQSDNKIVLGGSAIARYNSDGSLDVSFGINGKTTTLGSNNLAIQQDGKIVATGITLNAAGNGYDFTIERYNMDGSPDNTLSGDGTQVTDLNAGKFSIYTTAVQADGKIAVAYIDSENFAVARFNPDGSLDTTFGDDGKLVDKAHLGATYYHGAAVQSDGKIIAVGYTLNGTNFDVALARYNMDGSLDSTFSGDGKQTTDFGSDNDKALSVAIQNDGRIVIAGSVIARYNSDGSLDVSFGNNGYVASGEWNNVAIQTDSKIIVAGLAGISRYNSNGSPDFDFGNNGKIATDRWLGMALQKDGKIVVVTGNGRFLIARYNIDGSLDNTFSDDGYQTQDFYRNPQCSEYCYDGATARAVAIQEDGRIVVAGNWANNYKDFSSHFALARFNADGSLDSSFSHDGKFETDFGYATSVAIESDGKIIAAGSSNDEYQIVDYNPISDFAIIRFNDDGSLDSSFSDDGIQITAASGVYDKIQKIVISNNKLFAVGYGQYPGNVGIVARYLLDGSGNGNIPPSVNITTPSDNTTYLAPANIKITAIATDNDGSIQKVDFYNGSTLIFTEYNYPYSRIWMDVPAGDYIIAAVATDDKGLSTTSAPVHVTVITPEVSSFTLVDANTNHDLQALYDGIILDRNSLPQNLNIRANTTPKKVDSVVFMLDGKKVRIENGFPYALAGDNPPGDYHAWSLPLGEHTLTAIPYAKYNGVSEAGTPLIIHFTVVDQSNPITSPEKLIGPREEIRFALYPNPVNELLTLTTAVPQTNKTRTISILTASGATIKTFQPGTQSKTVQLDVSSLTPGTYIIKIISEDKVIYKQFVKI